jgi:hypothetical protein
LQPSQALGTAFAGQDDAKVHLRAKRRSFSETSRSGGGAGPAPHACSSVEVGEARSCDPGVDTLRRRPLGRRPSAETSGRRGSNFAAIPAGVRRVAAPLYGIVDINDAYAAATFTKKADIVGRSLFEIFPDNPDDALADGVSNLYASLRMVVQTGQPHAMAIQRYDVRDLQGRFVERHWQPINSPIHDQSGVLIYILHHVEDVTAEVAPRVGQNALPSAN